MFYHDLYDLDLPCLYFVYSSLQHSVANETLIFNGQSLVWICMDLPSSNLRDGNPPFVDHCSRETIGLPYHIDVNCIRSQAKNPENDACIS